jgi:hypothetical protein
MLALAESSTKAAAGRSLVFMVPPVDYNHKWKALNTRHLPTAKGCASSDALNTKRRLHYLLLFFPSKFPSFFCEGGE